MNDFDRKVEDLPARVSHTINEATERIEKEIPEIIKYLNDEIVPAVRGHPPKPPHGLAETRRVADCYWRAIVLRWLVIERGARIPKHSALVRQHRVR